MGMMITKARATSSCMTLEHHVIDDAPQMIVRINKKQYHMVLSCGLGI